METLFKRDSVSWRNWIKWLRENSKERTCWESRQTMDDCIWRERKTEEDWSRWRIRTRRQDCLLPATWPIRIVDGVKLNGEEGRSRRRIQSLWNWWRWWRRLEWILDFEGKSSDEVIDEETEWKPTWQKVRTYLQKAMESRRIKSYKSKEQQS